MPDQEMDKTIDVFTNRENNDMSDTSLMHAHSLLKCYSGEYTVRALKKIRNRATKVFNSKILFAYICVSGTVRYTTEQYDIINGLLRKVKN